MVQKKVARRRTGIVKFLMKNPVLVPIDSLKLWKHNPRTNDKAIPRLMEIFKSHGVRSRVVVWKENNTIYRGNTTFKTLKAMGSDVIAVDYQDFSSEAAAMAYGIADNKSSEFAEWDEDLLTEIMLNPEMMKFQHTVGFVDTELDGLLFKPDAESKDSAQGLLAKIDIICRPEMKNRVLEYLDKTVGRKFGDEVAIK